MLRETFPRALRHGPGERKVRRSRRVREPDARAHGRDAEIHARQPAAYTSDLLEDRRGVGDVHIIRMLDAVSEGASCSPRRRIVVLRREDGYFAFAEQYYYVDQYEGEIVAEGWATLQTIGVYATAEIAEAEGRAAMSRRLHASD